MAEIQDQFSGIIDSMFGGTFTLILWVFIGLIIVGIGGIVVYYTIINKKKYDILVKVISRRSGQNKVYFDNAAILRDKEKNTDYLRLKNSKAEIELPKFNIMHSTNRGDYIEILRDSERGYRFLTPPKIDKTYILRNNGKLYPIADLKQYQLENDLTWILERQKANKNLLDPGSILMKILEYTPQILSMAFSFIILWIVFRYAPQLLASMSDIVEKFGQQQQGGTEVIGGFIPLAYSIWKKKT